MEVIIRTTGQKLFKVTYSEPECMKEIDHLGKPVTNISRVTAEISHRTGKANLCYHRLKDMLKSRYL
jgi:hypothetical protein